MPNNSTWSQIQEWLYKPFQQPMDLVNWLLLLMLSATAAYMWARILDRILEE